MMKVLVQVVAVFTLVFGTCYQSVLALANDTRRVDLTSVQLNDKNGAKVNQVKVGEEQRLAMTVTISNKDGDQEDGSANLWLPENQLEVLKAQVKAEAGTADTNAKLYFERRRDKTLRLRWEKVATQMTFKLDLPVKLKTPMTAMALPVAVGSVKTFAQPVTVVAADTDDEALAEAGSGESLPVDLLAGLDQFVQSEKLQEQQAAEKAKEAETATENEVADEVTKDKNESDDVTEKQSEADKKKSEQDKTDQADEDAKTTEALKKNSRTADAGSKSDAQERETSDKATKSTKATDLSGLLAKNDDRDAVSFFNEIWLIREGQENVNVATDNVEVGHLDNFQVKYVWDSKTLKDKLKDSNHTLAAGDHYTFKIFGLGKYADGSTEGEITAEVDGKSEKVAEWVISNSSEDEDPEYQKVQITLSNPKMLDTNVKFSMTFTQKYTSGEEIQFEFNDSAIWTVTPEKEAGLLWKDGQFLGDNQIRWTVKLDVSGVEGDLRFDEIELVDQILNGAAHYLSEDDWDVYYEKDIDREFPIKEQFDITDDKTPKPQKVTISGKTAESVNKELGNLVFVINTTYTQGTSGTFVNGVKGEIKDRLTLTETTGSVSINNSIEKEAGKYDKSTGEYDWTATLNLDMRRYDDDSDAIDALKTLEIIDTLGGAHEYIEDSWDIELVKGAETGSLKKYFTVNFSEINGSQVKNQMTLKPSTDDEGELLKKLGRGETELKIIYKTRETGSSNVNAVKNSIQLIINDIEYDDSSSSGTNNDLITKKGVHDNSYVDGDFAKINWTLKVNEFKRGFTELTVMDILPAGVKATEVEIIVNDGEKDISVEIDKNNGPLNLHVKSGFSTGEVDGNLYDFGPQNDDRKREAIRFVFEAKGSEPSKNTYTITLKTKQKWIDTSFTNHSAAAITGGMSDYAQDTVPIDGKIVENVHKEGQLNLKNDPDSSKHTIEWEIGFGSRLNKQFGTDGSKVNSVKIRDWLNSGTLEHLSFPEKPTAFKLYEMKSISERGDLVDSKHYEITWTENNDTDWTFTITFNASANEKEFKHLALVFETPIDLSVWKEDGKSSTIPSSYQFQNDAKVSYLGFDEAHVDASAGLSGDHIYGDKTTKGVESNRINWQVVMNANGQNVGYPTITDTLKGNHIHDIDEDSLELSFVGVKHTSQTTNEGKEGSFNYEIDENVPPHLLKRGTDYDVEFSDDYSQMIIRMKTAVTRPLQLKYQTLLQAESNAYENQVSISADYYNVTYGKDVDFESSAFMERWSVRFTKVDGETKERLSGVQFKLQKWVAGEWVEAEGLDEKPYGTVVSDEHGYVQFRMLGTMAKYRLIEVGARDGYDGQIPPIEFDMDSAEAAGWLQKSPEIKNYAVEPGNLTLRKLTAGLADNKQFNFKVYAYSNNKVNNETIVDTNFNGSYKLSDGSTVKFTNGVSETIKVTGGEPRTILNLPTEGYDADEKAYDREYQVEETSTGDFMTSIAVNGDDYQPGNLSGKFKLEKATPNAVTINVKNTARKGNLELSKQVISSKAEDLTKPFEFTIQAVNDETKDKVANERFSTEGPRNSIRFDQDGQATVYLKHTEQLLIKDLPENAQFKITEKIEDDFTTASSLNGNDFAASQVVDVTIENQTDQTAVFKNSREDSGQIRLEKRIAGNVDAEHEFDFTIKADKALSGKYRYEIYQLNQQHGEDGDDLVFDSKNEATITLKGDQYALIYGLPLGTAYTITEENPNVKNMTTSWQTKTSSKTDSREADPITLKSSNAMEKVTFTNELPNGELTLGKRVVSGVAGDQAKLFEFVIQAKDETVDDVKDQKYAVSNYEDKQIRFDGDGRAVVNLEHKQTITISGLPAGAKFTIKETPQAEFKITHQVNDGPSHVQDTTGLATEIVKDDTQKLIYTNTRRGEGDLLLEKIAMGTYPTDKLVTFTITDRLNLTEDFEAILKRADGTEAKRTVKFVAGKTEVEINPGEQMLIKGLPEQSYTVREEDQDDNVVTTSQINSGDFKYDVEANPAEVQNNDTVVVTFTNRIETGDLTLRKTVVSDDKADMNQEFKFEIRADETTKNLVVGKTYKVTNHPETKKVEFDAEGVATLTLKHGDEVVINELPVDVSLTVVETETAGLTPMWNLNNQGGYQDLTTTQTPEVTIAHGENDVISYRNSEVPKPPVGSLRIDKIVTGADNSKRSYKFEVQADIDDGGYPLTVYQRETGHLAHSRQLEFEDGNASLELKADQYAVIDNLPLNDYTVSEVDPDIDNMETTWSANNKDPQVGLEADSQPVTADKITLVTFNNRIKTGTLVVEKQVKDTNNLDQSFEFTIEAHRRHQTNTHFNGDYTATFTRQDGTQTTETVTFKDGQLKVNLKHGDKVQLNHLPTGVRFKVSEQKVDRFDATYQVDGGEQQDHQAGPTIKIKDEKQTTVRYTNTWQGDGQLLLEKIAAGDYPTNTPIDFEITAQDDLNGTFAATYTQANGHKITKQVPFEAGQAKVTFMPGERLLIKNLPLQNYTVTEAKQADRVETTWQVDEQKGEGLTTQPIALKQGHTSHVTYTNLIKSGSVIVEKQVTGAMVAADLNRQFEFTLAAQREVTTDEVDDDSTTAPTTTEPVYELDKLFEGDYKATLTRADGEQVTQTVTFEAGQLVTKLRAGERLQIKGLPEEQRLIISETPEVEFITTHQVNGGEVTAGHETTGITTSSDQVQRVTFMNDRPVTPQVTWLALTKSVLGEAGEKDRAFNFNVYLHDHVLNPITGTVQIIKTTAAGISETGQLMLDENGAGQVALQHGETVRIELPDGAHYQIVEDDYTSDGYVTTTSQGANPVREGTTVTGVVSQSQPNAAKVVYYNRADPVTEDQPHTDTDDDETTPDFVGPATENPSDDLEGSALPQAHTSTGTGSGTTSTRPMSSSSKGFLPQTGEFLKDNWLMVLGLLILVTAFGVKVTLMKKRK